MLSYFLRPLLLLCSLLPALAVAAGPEWSAVVVAAETAEPVPFASVGVVGAGVGTVADADGRFRLAVDPARHAAERLRVSALGFRSREWTIGAQTPAELPDTVYLEAIAHRLSVVDVRAERLGKLRSYGLEGTPDNVTFYFQSDQLGTEAAAELRIRDPRFYVKQLNFYVLRNNYGTVSFRVHLYDFSDRDPTTMRELTTENIILKTDRRSGWVSVDVSDQDLVLEGVSRVLLSLEWLEDLNPRGRAADLQFGATLTTDGSIYVKRAAQDDWAFFRKRYYGLRTRLGFNLEGYPLDRNRRPAGR